jgi:hypothetical protein
MFLQLGEKVKGKLTIERRCQFFMPVPGEVLARCLLIKSPNQDSASSGDEARFFVSRVDGEARSPRRDIPDRPAARSRGAPRNRGSRD